MVDWSWELLNGAERAVLARLSVFAGGFGLAAAEAIAAGADVPAAEVLGLLGTLVDKSLVQFSDTGAGPGRYRLLETVRQYAAGQLTALGPAVAEAARSAHLDYYRAFAEEAAPQLTGPDQAEWLDRLDAELGNLRAAAGASLTQPDPEPGLRLAASLWRFWRIRGHGAEGVGVLRALLDTSAAQPATLPRARALAAAAYLLEATGGYATAADYCEEALAIARAAGDEHLIVEVLHHQALVLVHRGQIGPALPLIDSALGLAHRLGKPRLSAFLMSTRSYIRDGQGDPAGAGRDARESVRLARQGGDKMQLGRVLGNLGAIELSAGALDAARRHLAESLDIARALNDRSSLVSQTHNLGLVDFLGGSPEVARAWFAETLELARRTGMRSGIAHALLGLALARPGGADQAWSARLHGAADQAFADLGHALEPLEARLADQDRENLRASMGAEAFAAEYGAGRTLDQAQVLAEDGRPRPPAAGQPRAAGSDEAVKVLTPRELDVLRLVTEGLSNQDIARQLVLSEHTVHRHLANILRKLGLSSRAAAAAWGVRTGLA